MLSIYSYSIPFSKPFVTSNKTFTHREGLVIQFEDVISEIAPLPGFSVESLEEAKTQLSRAKDNIADPLQYLNTAKSWSDFVMRSSFLPSVRFGIDMLWWQHQAKKLNVSLLKAMSDKDLLSVEINATIPISDNLDDVAQEAINKNDEGFSTLKFKVGVNWQKEYAALMYVRSFLPDVKIRLDANGAWSQKEAEVNLEMCSDISIEYCEQPVSTQEMTEYVIHSNFQDIIAPDESILLEHERSFWIDNPIIKQLIIKPTLFGSFSELRTIREKYPEKKFIFTSGLDTGIANYLGLHIAASLGTDQVAHGFGTISWLQNDLLKWKHPTSPVFSEFVFPFISASDINFDLLTEC